VIDYLNKRGISSSTAQKCNIQDTLTRLDHIGSTQQIDSEGKHQRCITFPMYKFQGGEYKLVRNKIRSLTEKSFQKLGKSYPFTGLEPKGGEWGMFGFHLVPPDAKEIILTEGEFDAMAVHQATNLPAVSIPNGCRSLPIQIIPMLERFEKIYLWMDNDMAGQEGVEIFTRKLGLARCYICQSTAKDANEALLKRMDMNAILSNAKPLNHNQILSFSNLKDQVKQSLFSKDLSGTSSLYFPKLNKIQKGHRSGELSLISGPTGIGKTVLFYF
jgi:twinkle protein